MPRFHGGGDHFFTSVDVPNFSIGEVTIHKLLVGALEDIQERIYDTARHLAPEDTGILKREGIGKTPIRRIAPNIWRGTVGLKREPFYGIFVHDGTGIYGPRKSPIVPRTAPYLKFTIGDRTFRLKSVRGQEAQPFVTEAYRIVNDTYVPFRVEELRVALRALAG